MSCRNRNRRRLGSSNTAKNNVQFSLSLEIIQDVTKKRQQELIYEPIKKREELYEQQAFKQSQIKNNEEERLRNQMEELFKKQAEL